MLQLQDVMWESLQAGITANSVQEVGKVLHKVEKDFSNNWESFVNEQDDYHLDDTFKIILDNLFRLLRVLNSGIYETEYSVEVIQKCVCFSTSLLRVIHTEKRGVHLKRPVDLDHRLAITRTRYKITNELVPIVTELKDLTKKLTNAVEDEKTPVSSLAILLSEPHIKEIWQKWLSMDTNGVIREAVGMSQMTLLHSFLISQGDYDGASVLAKVDNVVQGWVEELLMEEDLEKVHSIYKNMGIEPFSKLREKLAGTQNSRIRAVLNIHLSDCGKLSTEEECSLHLLQRINSMLHAVQGRSNTDVFSLTVLTLSDVLQWSKEHVQMVMVEFMFLLQDTQLLAEIHSEIIWKYLLMHNDLDRLNRWIDSSFTEEPESHVSSFEAALHQRKITTMMIDSLFDINTLEITRTRVLNKLCRCSVYCSKESQDVSLILRRFLSSHNLTEPVFDTLFAPDNLHELLIEFYVKNNLPNALLSHLDRYDSTLPHSILESLLTRQKQWWLPLVIEFQTWYRSSSDVSSFCRLALESVRCLLSSKNLDTEEHYLLEHPLVALSIIIPTQASLLEMNRSVFHRAMDQIPVLKKALTTLQPNQPPLKISVYDLLKGKSDFDVSRVFQWQTAVRKTDNSFPEPPHFGSSALLKQYGHKEILNFVYFLKQGRPSYAVSRAALDILQKYKNLSRKSVQDACSLAQGLALQHYLEPMITAACIAFVEMMGRSSMATRISVAVANYLSSSGVSQNEIDALMRGLIFTPSEAASQLLCLLEKALVEENEFQTELSSTSSSDVVYILYKWGLAVSFARLYSLPLPEQFLNLCAKRNQWLTFILILHIFQYPVDQAFKVIREFSSKALQQHFHYAFLRVPSLPQESSLTVPSKMKTRDTRQMLYSRIGVKKCDSSNDSGSDAASSDPLDSGSLSSIGTLSDDSTGNGSDMLDLHYAETDFYSVLYSCHLLPEPGKGLLANAVLLKNPVYAVIATFYEAVTVTSCFCTWLYMSLTSEVQESLSSMYEEPLQHHSWTQNELEKLLEQALLSRHVSTIVEGMQIFLTENPLYSLACFLQQCISKHNFKMAKVHLKAFQAGCQNLKFMMQSSPVESRPLFEPSWITSVAVKLVFCTLCDCLVSSVQKLKFLDLLCQLSFAELLPVEMKIADLCHLRDLQKSMLDSGIGISFRALLLGTDSTNYQVEVNCLLQDLVRKKYFGIALDFAEVAGLTQDFIIVEQLKLRFMDEEEQHHLQTEEARISFWNECNQAARDSHLCWEQAAGFFKDHANCTHTQKERFHVLQLSWMWLKEGPAPVEQQDEVEVDLWWCILWGEMEQQYVGDIQCLMKESRILLKADITLMAQMCEDCCQKQLENLAQVKALERIIDGLLRKGNIVTAWRVEYMFCEVNKELEVLRSCIDLAEGEITVEKFRRQLPNLARCEASSLGRKLLEGRRPRTLSLGSRGGGKRRTQRSSSVCESPRASQLERERILESLQQTVNSLSSGWLCGQKIINCYRVSMALDEGYKAVVQYSDPLLLIRKVLRNDKLEAKYELAHGIVMYMQISQADLADFLCDEVVTAINKERKGGHTQMGDDSQEASDVESNFSSLINICEDCSLLGNRLLTRAQKLTSNQGTSKEVLALVVELYIGSHDCYTQVCNMEGICLVLRKVRILVQNLMQLQHWGLLVRLLTGIGRYTELDYIFDILRECEQFEFLLGKGMDKIFHFKVAILEYLKRSCPENKELFRLVAQHFMMNKEVAEIWKSEAQSSVNDIIAANPNTKIDGSYPGIINQESIRQGLSVAMQNYVNAAEYYNRAEKLSRALDSAHQAEMLALQQYLLSTVAEGKPAFSLLALQPKDINYLMSSVLNFAQGMIVANAYNHPIDWAAVLYEQVVLNASLTYLKDFQESMALCGSLTEEIVKKYQRDFKLNRGMETRMKQLISETDDLKIKYYLASQLGFKDIISVILDSPQVTFLKDTVWKKGLPKQL